MNIYIKFALNYYLMLIDRINKKVKTFLNTDVRGNYSPENFNEFLHDAIQERNEDYFDELKKAVNRENRGLNASGLENIPEKYREKINHYLKEGVLTLISDTRYSLPDDYRYIDSIGTSDGIEYGMCRNSKEFKIYKNFAKAQDPVCLFVGGVIKIFPETTDDIEVVYLRTIKYPKWTYEIINGVETFNPDADDFEDADIHPSEEEEMVKAVLLRFGVHLKELDIQSYAEKDEQMEFHKRKLD